MKIGVWAHPIMNYVEGSRNIDSSFKNMAKAGISIYYPYACLRGNSCYPSKLVNQVTNEDFLKKIIEAASSYGIEVHPIVAFTTPKPDLLKPFIGHGAPKGMADGHSVCPSWESNRQLVLGIMTELLENYEIKGIHLDYMRYPDSSYSLMFPCECEVCRSYRKRRLGEEVFSGEDMKDPGKLYIELCMRAEHIKSFIVRIRNMTLSRSLELSMAAREDYTKFALSEGQDWVEWSREGLVDVICPMSYTTNLEKFKAFADEHSRLLKGGKAKYFAGIGRKSNNGELKPNDMIEQIRYSKEKGASGCTIFHFGALTEEDLSNLGDL